MTLPIPSAACIRRAAALVLAASLIFGLAGCSRQARKERHMDRAEKYLKAQKTAEAELELLNAARLDQRDPTLLRRIGMLYYDQGRYLKAAAFFTRAKSLKADDLVVREKLASLNLMYGKVKEAREEAAYVLSQKPDYSEAMVILVETAQTNRLVEVRGTMEKIGPYASHLPGYHMAMAALQLREGDAKRAQATLEAALKDHPNSGELRMALGNYFEAVLRDSTRADAELRRASELVSARSPIRLRYVNYLVGRTNLDEARRVLDASAAEAPDFIPLLLRAADVAMGQRRFDDCEALLNKVQARDPGNYEGLLLQARSKLAKGDLAQAIQGYERLTKSYPRLYRLHYELGTAYLKNREMDKAIASIEQSTILAPIFSEGVVLLAELKMRKGDYTRVVELLGQLTKRVADPRAFMILAGAYRARGNYEDAIATYHRTAQLFPKAEEPHLMLAELLRVPQVNRKKEAREALETALAIDPGSFVALEGIITLDLEENRIKDAEARLQGILAKDPKSIEATLLFSKVYKAQGDLKRAEASLNKALEMKPESRVAQMALAWFYIENKREKDAIARLEMMTASQTNDVKALMMLGELHLTLGQFAEAAATYDRVLAVNPGTVQALNNLAVINLEHLQRTDRALELATRAHDLNPNDPFCADTLGWVLYRKGDYPGALQLLQAGAERLPNEPEAQYHLGMTYYMLGDSESARIALEAAVRSSKEFKHKSEARDRLQVLKTQAKTQPTGGVAELEKRLAQTPGDPILQMQLAAAYEAAGQTNKAVELYERLIKQSSRNVAAMVSLGRLFESQRNRAKALELARMAHNAGPEDPNAAHLLGRLAMEGKDHKYALSLLQQSGRKLTGDAAVQHDLAWALYAMGRVGEAQAAMRRVIEIGTPAFGEDARRFLALAPPTEGSVGGSPAAAQAQQVLATKPKYLPAWFLSGRALEDKKDYAGARQVYEAILGEYPYFTPVNARLAVLYAGPLKDLAKAYDHAMKTREANPEDPDASKQLGLVQFARNDFQGAQVLLKESARKLTNDADVFYYLGIAHSSLKQTNEARNALRQALLLNDNAPWAGEAKKALGTPK